MELDPTKTLDLHIKTSDILALILTVLGVILFIAYPLYQAGEDSFSMFSIAKSSYWLWIMLVL